MATSCRFKDMSGQYRNLLGRGKKQCHVFPVKYELDYYIPEDYVLHSHRCKSHKSYIAINGCAV
jgi:hypothetical protein